MRYDIQDFLSSILHNICFRPNLISRLLPPLVFDCLQCDNTEDEGLGDSSHRCRNEMEGNEMAGSGRTSSGLPIKKCLGVSASTPLSSHGKATSGLLLRQASILLKQL